MGDVNAAVERLLSGTVQGQSLSWADLFPETYYYGGRHKDTDYIYYSSDILLQLQQHCFKWVFVF